MLNLMPLDVVWSDGCWHSLSNRRLFILKKFSREEHCNDLQVHAKVHSLADPKVQNWFRRAYTTLDAGCSVQVRNVSGWADDEEHAVHGGEIFVVSGSK